MREGFLRRKRWTREREVEELRKIVGQRELAISEINYNQTDGWTDEQVAEFMAWEREFWGERMAYVFCCAYQIDDTTPSTYGFRDVHKRWRPVLQAWTGVEQTAVQWPTTHTASS